MVNRVNVCKTIMKINLNFQIWIFLLKNKQTNKQLCIRFSCLKISGTQNCIWKILNTILSDWIVSWTRKQILKHLVEKALVWDRHHCWGSTLMWPQVQYQPQFYCFIVFVSFIHSSTKICHFNSHTFTNYTELWILFSILRQKHMAI